MVESNFFISKEELYQKYIVENISQSDLCKIYGVTRKMIKVKLKKYNIVKSMGDRIEANRKKIIAAYATGKTQEKQRSYWAKEENRLAMKQKVKAAYATGKPQEKIKKKLAEKYQEEGFLENRGKKIKEAYENDSTINDRRSQTLKKNYEENPEIKAKISAASIRAWRNYTPEKIAERNEKIRKTSMINNSYYKAHLTKKENGTYKKSKEEEQVYVSLLKVFPDVIHLYSDDRYINPYTNNHWECDFYIPSLDLFIEYQGHWRHGKEPFDSNKKPHQELLKRWETKSQEKNNKGEYKKQYLAAIEKWTVSDPLKREIAQKHNLNYKEFFNLEEFYIWLKEQENL